MKKISILGTRGVPASHGGFETFAEYLAMHLVNAGWHVTVYCQEVGKGNVYETMWNGVHRVHIPVASEGAKSTVIFDLFSICHAVKQRNICLTLGYNTAIFNFLLSLFMIKNVINMDGIEWKRSKWGRLARSWFWFNELAGILNSTVMIADHPCIKEHLGRFGFEKKIRMIPYGADANDDCEEKYLSKYGLTYKKYAIVVARAEPENSIFEIVSAFSRKHRDFQLLVIGNYSSNNDYQRKVLNSASNEVLFPGAIYDKTMLKSLRSGALFYIHGHQVGGTNPSLVEALASSNAVLAHDNRFNRWVSSDAALYFKDVDECSDKIDTLIYDSKLISRLSDKARSIHAEKFRWEMVLKEYEALFDTL